MVPNFLENAVKKLSENGHEQRSERGFGRYHAARKRAKLPLFDRL
jgi:hypothetical protein